MDMNLPTAKPTGNAAPEASTEGQGTVGDGIPNVSPEEQQQYETFVKEAAKLIYIDTPQGSRVNPAILQALTSKGDAQPAQTPKPGGLMGSPSAQPSTSDTAPAVQDGAVASMQAADTQATAPAAIAGDPDPNGGSSPVGMAPHSTSAPTDSGTPTDAQAGAHGEGNAHIVALANTAVQIVAKLDDSARASGVPIPDEVLYHGSVEIIEELGQVAMDAKLYDYSEKDLQGALYQAIDIYRPKLEESGRTSKEILTQQFQELNQASNEGKLGQVLPGLPDHKEA